MKTKLMIITLTFCSSLAVASPASTRCRAAMSGAAKRLSRMVGAGGIEPLTSCVSSRRSNR